MALGGATALLLLAGPAIAVDSIGLAKMRRQTAESGPASVPRGVDRGTRINVKLVRDAQQIITASDQL